MKVPVGVGFGIRDAQTARAVAEVADAVVIGSALVQLLESTSATRRRASLAVSSPASARRSMLPSRSRAARSTLERKCR